MTVDSQQNGIVPVFTAAGFRRGAVAALPFIVSNGVAGVVMGVAYRGLGLGIVPSVLFSVVVYSGTAQAVMLGLWAVPPPLPAMVIATVATNARYLVMGAHLRQLFGRLPAGVMYPVLFLFADASWLMTTSDAGRGRPDAGYLLGSSVPMAVGWIGGTALGNLVPLQPSGALAAAAAMLPLTFVVALLPSQWRGARCLLPWAASAAAAVLAVECGLQSWAMLIGGGAGTLVSLANGHAD